VALSISERYGAELHMLHAIVLHEDHPHHPAHHFPDLQELYKLLAWLIKTAHVNESAAKPAFTP